MITQCKLCDLHKDRKQVVIGRGSKGRLPHKADILFIGEAPGVAEDTLGVTFVGQAGKLLYYTFEKVIEHFHGFMKMSYYIINTILCHPVNKDPNVKGNNRKPTKDEIESCRDNIELIFKIVKPKYVILVGKVAEESYRKYVKQYKHISIMHPAFHLRKGGTASPRLQTDIRKIVDLLKEG